MSRTRNNNSAACFYMICVVPLLLTGMPAQGMSSRAGGMKWTHFTMADPLPGSAWGTGGLPLADFDGDGDIDMVSKVWNKDGPTYHADYWRNDSPRRQ